MLRNRIDRLVAVLGVLLLLSGCTNAQPAALPTPPVELDTFDGVPRSRLVTHRVLEIDPGPDAAALFDRVMACYPAPSWFRPEITAELRAGARTYNSAGETVGQGVGVVMRIPLFSGVEVDRERERESMRRLKVAGSAGAFLQSLVTYRLKDRELDLMRGIEARARDRVAAGLAETAEQLAALREVAALENGRVDALTKLTTARLELVGLCSAEQSAGLSSYLRQFQPLEPGHRTRGDR